MSFSEHWKRYGKCAAGVISGIIAGVFGGVAVESSIPWLGALGCAIVGGIGGALGAATQSCE